MCLEIVAFGQESGWISKRLSACLQLLKEIPIKIGEALSLKWTEIDSERRIIYVNTTEKDGKPRVFKISEKLPGW